MKFENATKTTGVFIRTGSTQLGENGKLILFRNDKYQVVSCRIGKKKEVVNSFTTWEEVLNYRNGVCCNDCIGNYTDTKSAPMYINSNWFDELELIFL